MDIIYGVVKEVNFGIIFVEEGLLIIFWNDEVIVDDVLFILVVCVKVVV